VRKRSEFICLLVLGAVIIISVLAIFESEPTVTTGKGSNLKSHFKMVVPKLMNKYKVPGVAVAFIDKGETTRVQSYGWEDIEAKKGVTEDTVFQVASNSKTLTAWGVMKLVEDGKLELDAPVEKYLTRFQLPDSKFDHNQVTIRRILSHTAGLSVRGYPGYHPGDRLPGLEDSLSGKYSELTKVKVVFKPGIKYKYSGGGYTLLQLVIEEVTGKPFSRYMEDEILRPLGMENSSFEWRTDLQVKTAKAYDVLGFPLPNYLFTEKAAAGLYTTAPDFARFVAANLDNPKEDSLRSNLIGKSTLSLMCTPVKKDYGLGYIVKRLPNGRRLIYHGGSNRGWRSQFTLLPELDKGLVILTNSENGYKLHRDLVSLWTKWETGFYPQYHLIDVTLRILIKALALMTILYLIIRVFYVVKKLIKRKLLIGFNKQAFSRKKLMIMVKAFIPLVLSFIWWIVFYTGFLYNGWTFASFMPDGFFGLTLTVFVRSLLMFLNLIFVHDQLCFSHSISVEGVRSSCKK
jgi:CubicO group peptidase (beta-lactamase class C family)